jgi:hypothetical protein
VAAAVVLAFPATASALSGRPILAGMPLSNQQPAVAVDSSGTAYIAWADTEDKGGATDFVQYCVIPAGAGTCAHTGNLMPAGSATHIDAVRVLVDGTTAVVLADVSGGGGFYEPEQEWQSSDGGATFNPAGNGLSVAAGSPSASTAPVGAVLVPGTNELGYGWTTGGSGPTFNAFPLSPPSQCSAAQPCQHATLQTAGVPDQIGNAGGQFASQLGPSPGVLAIFKTDFSGGYLGCLGTSAPPFGMAFAYGTGVQSATNDYDIDPGVAGSAWKVAVTLADCDVKNPAVAGGASGFGVIEDNELSGNIVYHAFDQAHEDFDTHYVTVAKHEMLDPAMSQDAAGGIYATYLYRNGTISLSYSGNGGASWFGPGTLDRNADGGAANVTSSVGPTGQGWVVWTDKGSVRAEQFDKGDAAPFATSIKTRQRAGRSYGASVKIVAGTVGESDTATVGGGDAGASTGTVHYALYSSKTCISRSKVFDGGTAAVTSGRASSSKRLTAALPAGRYYWQAVYSGDGLNAGSVSACGAEVLTVLPIATISGTATTTAKTVTVAITCTSTPCRILVAIIGGPSAALGGGTFTIRHSGLHRLTVKLSKLGGQYVVAVRGRLNATLLVAERIHGHAMTTARTIKIKPAKHL